VGADQRSLTVTGLANGETYQFAVHAVNRKGDGPARTSNSVRPTAEVPDAPTAITATARPDGTVAVSWPAADGQGLKIRQYTVTAISEGGSAPIGDATGTSLTIASGKLQYGTQYAFTVVAINERGAGSKPSPVSASVVPFTKPGKPLGLDATTVAAQAGTIKVAWQAPPDNGRPITRYVVAAGGKTQEVTEGTTAVTLTGLGNGQSVQVQVRAVNEAGESESATTTATTVAAPKVTITGGSTTFNSATITVAVDAGGGTPSCTLTVSGKTAKGNCSSLEATGLKPSGSEYTLKVTATNAAGSASASRTLTTADLYGNATCIDNKDSSDPAQRVYCDEDRSGRNGNEIFAEPDQASTQVGWVKTGTAAAHLLVYCKKSGDNVDPYVYNKHSASSWWLQIDYKGRTYIPYAWLYLEQGDDIDAVATC